MAPSALFSVVITASALPSAQGQFGGGFGGGGGGNPYTPPAPVCPMFTCPANEKAVPKPDLEIVSYGCKDSGMNVFSAGMDFDPNDPLGSMKKGGKNLNKCCVERDICKQTCGASARECHDGFQKCQQKICKGDQNCQLQAMISDMSGDPYDEDRASGAGDKDKKYDPEETKCRGYKKAQQANCQCVPKAEVKDKNEAKLKAFYAKHNPEKLDDMGDIKDVDDVWKKWKGKEPAMFMALATKYKDKAVTMKEKPKYKPPSDREGEEQEEEDNTGFEGGGSATVDPVDEVDDGVVEDAWYRTKAKDLEKRKQKAKDDEDYDLAGELKAEMSDLRAKELEKLNTKKGEAIEAEDYAAAKKIKERIKKLEL